MPGRHPIRRARARDHRILSAAAQPAAGHRPLRARQSRRDGAVHRRRDRARGGGAAVGGDPLRQCARLSGLHRPAAHLPRAAGGALGDLSRAHRADAAQRRREGQRVSRSSSTSVDARARAPARARRPAACCSRPPSLVVRRGHGLPARAAARVPGGRLPRLRPRRSSTSARSCSIRSAACCASRSALIRRGDVLHRRQLSQLHAEVVDAAATAHAHAGASVIAITDQPVSPLARASPRSRSRSATIPRCPFRSLVGAAVRRAGARHVGRLRAGRAQPAHAAPGRRPQAGRRALDTAERQNEYSR